MTRLRKNLHNLSKTLHRSQGTRLLTRPQIEAKTVGLGMLEGGILAESDSVRTVQSYSLPYPMTSLEITIMSMPLKGLNVIS